MNQRLQKRKVWKRKVERSRCRDIGNWLGEMPNLDALTSSYWLLSSLLAVQHPIIDIKMRSIPSESTISDR